MNDFRKLKTLLLQEEIDKIESITKEISSLQEQQKQDILVEKFSHIITDIIIKNLKDSPDKLYGSLQPVISKGVLNEISNTSSNLKKALFPLISSALQEQIHKQKNSIVDALYPIMGNMISKYVTSAFSDMMHEVNHTIQSSFSFTKVKRKIKSKLYGISEAELILQETNFLDVKTIFLIHKESGLLITEISKDDDSAVQEVEMVASMLSAIRSFVNDWISSHDTMSEISEIEYGSSSIQIQSAGSCYIAIVLNKNANLKESVSKVLSSIIDKYSYELQQYDGDRSKLNIEDIQEILSTLFTKKKEQQKGGFPFISLMLLATLVLLPTYFYLYNTYKSNQIAKKEQSIRDILKEYRIHVYDLAINTTKKENIVIHGLILKQEDIEKTNYIFRGFNHTNNLKSIDYNFKYNYNSRKLESVTKEINQKYNSRITYSLKGSKIIINGTLLSASNRDEIIGTFNNYFSNENIYFNIKILRELSNIIYFNIGSSNVSAEYSWILDKIAYMHKKHSNYYIKISSYVDSHGSKAVNKKISYSRANNIRDDLIKRGIEDHRLIVKYNTVPPNSFQIDSNSSRKKYLNSRCVLFKWESINDE